jgi:hypothetical protein
MCDCKRRGERKSKYSEYNLLSKVIGKMIGCQLLELKNNEQTPKNSTQAHREGTKQQAGAHEQQAGT